MEKMKNNVKTKECLLIKSLPVSLQSLIAKGMAADIDMETVGGEGWGEDAELQLDEGKANV